MILAFTGGSGAFLGREIAVRSKWQRGNVDSNLDNISCITFPLCNYL